MCCQYGKGNYSTDREPHRYICHILSIVRPVSGNRKTKGFRRGQERNEKACSGRIVVDECHLGAIHPPSPPYLVREYISPRAR